MKKTSKPVKASRKLIKRIKQEQAISHEVVQPPVAQTPDDALPAQSVVASLPEQALKEEAVQPAVSTMVDAALDAAAQSVASAPLDLSLSLWAQAGAAAAAVDAGAGAGAAAGTGASTAAGAAAATTTAAATTAAVATGAALSTGAIVAGVAAVGVAAAAAGGGGSSSTAAPVATADTTPPTLVSVAAHSISKTIELTYSEALDATNIRVATGFTVTTNGVANVVSGISVSGSVVTLTLTDAFAVGNAITVSYADLTTGNDLLVIQDAAGNDTADFSVTSGVAADGYVRGASVYIDKNNNGVADPATDYFVGTTDASGNFFIPSGAPSGTVIVFGGINIDTGVANTTVLKAPAGSTTVNPLTTLVQAVVQASGGTTTAAAAASTVAASLGLTAGLAGQSLLNYDPISSGNVVAQKAAAQIATIAAMAETSTAGAGATVLSNLATVVNNAGSTPVVLADASTISSVLPAAVQANAAVQSAIADASSAIDNAASLAAISTAQSQALDTIAPTAPTSLSVAATTKYTTPSVQVNFNTTATNGTAASAGDTITLRENGVQAGTAVTLTAADIAAGYKLVDASTLSEGSHTLSAVLIDQAGNVSSAATGVVVNIDTQAPAAPAFALGTDSGTSSSDRITNVGTVNVTSLESGASWQYSTNSGTSFSAGTGTSFTLAAGNYAASVIQVKQTDAAGNTGSVISNTGAIVVDLTAPTATAAVTSGAAIINDNTPALAGTIVGTLGSGEGVAVYDGATRLGLATVTGTTWTFNTPSLSNAAHSFTAKVEDAAGNSGSAGTAYAVTVNATVPTATATITTATDDVAAITGNIASGGISNDSIPVLGGAVVGTLGTDAVVIYDGATRLGTATVTGTSWSYTPSALSAGAHSFTAVVETNAGNQGAMSTAYSLTLDLTAPNAAVINPVAIDNLVNASEKAAGIVVTGTAEAGSAVAVTWGTAAKSATATGGVWSVTFASADVPADNAASTISATATDVAGNLGIAATRTVAIDSTGPSAQFALVGATSVTGNPNIAINSATTITGTTEANAKLALTVGSGNIRSLTANGSGAWSYQLTAADIKAMGQGSETLSVTATDAAGNSGAAVTQGITIDTTAPVLTAFSLTDASDSGTKGDGRSNVAAPTISFTAELGATLAIDAGGGSYVAAGTGTGSVQTLPKPSDFSADGTYVINLKATDAAGNITVRTGNYIYDKTAPTVALTAATDDVGSVTGTLVSGATTDDTALRLSGTNEAGATVKVYNGATLLGNATVSGTTWSYTATVADGTTYQFNAKATDAAGNTSAATANFTVIGDTTAPAVALTAATDDVGAVTGALTTGATTDDTALLLSGTNEAGAVVKVYNGATLLGSAAVSGTTWSYSATVANATTYLFNAKATDAAGNTSAATANFTVIGDTTPPTATAAVTGADDNVQPTTGNVASGGTTNDPTLGLSGSITGTLATGDVVSVYDGATRLGLASLAVNGSAWTYNTATLGNAAHNFTARVEDAAGNQGSAGTPYVVTVNASVPTATATITGAADDVAGITGNVATGGTSNDSTPTLSGAVVGTLASGEVVAIYDGATKLANATVNAATWSYTPPSALSGGAHSFTAVVESSVGNQGPATTAYALTLDLTAPAAPAFALATDSGTSSSDGITNVGVVNVTGLESGASWQYSTDGGTNFSNGTGTSFTLTAATYAIGAVKVRQIDAAGNTGSAAANTAAITVDATAPAAPAVALATDSGLSAGDGITNVGTVNVTGLESGASWQYSTNGGTSFNPGTGTSFTLVAGTYAANAVQVKQTDIAGNTGVVGGNVAAINMDTTAPAAPAFALATDSGTSSSDGITNIGTVNVTGLEPGASWQYSTDGGTNFSNGTGTSFSLTAATYAPAAIKVRQIDVAGNTGSVISNTSAIVVDLLAPTATAAVTGADDNLAPITGNVSSGGTTNDPTLGLSGTVTGTLATGDVVSVYDGATRLGLAAVTGSTWTYATATLGNSAHNFTARVEDAAGNQGSAGTPYVVTVNASVPTATATITGAADDVAGITGNVATGGTSNDSTPTLSGAVVGTLASGEVVAIYDGATKLANATVNAATWSYTPPTALSGGAHSFTAVVESSVGSQGTASSAYALTLDLVNPAQPVVALASDTGASAADGITSVGTVNVSGIEAGATWQYSVNSGAFITGTGTSFTLAAGTYTANAVQVKQTDAAGNTSSVGANAGAITVDTTAPTLTTATVNGAVLTLTFNETIDSANIPASAPVVLVNGVAGAVSSVAFSGAVVTLNLTTPVISSDVVTFSYTDPTSGNDANALQDLAGNDVASGAAIPVTNQTVVATPPTLSASLLDNVTNLEVSSNIVLNFSANVSAAAGKYIHIVNDANSVTGAGFRGESTVNTLDILVTDSTQVTIAGGKVTINPTADLDLANNYHITIDAGAFTASASGAAMAAYDGTTTLNFSTVTPGTTALANAAASQVMNADGTLGSGHLWLDIEGIGSPSASAGTALDLSANSYALMAKDYDTAGGSAGLGYDGVKTADFYVAANNFGANDLLYIDNQGGAANDVTLTNIINLGTPPTTVQFAGTGLGGFVDISIASSTATFDTIAQLKTLLGTTTSPVISA